MRYLILLHFFLGPLVLFAAMMLKIFPPKNMESRYGYPSFRARKSRLEWEAANEYSTNLLAIVAMITIGVQVICGLIFEPLTGIIVSVVFQTAAMVSIIPLTENYLKKNFDESGNKIFLHH